MSAEIRSRLRAMSVLTGDAPPWDPDEVDEDPVSQFLSWLTAAEAAGVMEPHAMTLATTDSDGLPDARVLILKDADLDGWHFAVHSDSPKGRQLACRSGAALVFHWREQVRQIRVCGPVVADGEMASAADFLARPVGARTLALIGRQSEPLHDPSDVDEAIAHTAARLATDPTHVPPEWVSYAVRPTSVEFWQGSPDRRHLRVRYERRDVGLPWTRAQRWP